MKTLLLLAATGFVAAALPAHAQNIQPRTEFRVALLAPISTEINQKGDKITARIISPAEFAGGMMEGEVKESKSGKKLKGTSVLTFAFSTIVRNQTEFAVTADVTGFANSQGKANVDEEGRVIEKKSNLGKIAVASGIGALIGALAGGGKGAAIGAGVGGATALLLVQVAAKGPNIRFAAGSEFTLSVSPRRK